MAKQIDKRTLAILNNLARKLGGLEELSVGEGSDIFSEVGFATKSNTRRRLNKLDIRRVRKGSKSIIDELEKLLPRNSTEELAPVGVRQFRDLVSGPISGGKPRRAAKNIAKGIARTGKRGVETALEIQGQQDSKIGKLIANDLVGMAKEDVVRNKMLLRRALKALKSAKFVKGIPVIGAIAGGVALAGALGVLAGAGGRKDGA